MEENSNASFEKFSQPSKIKPSKFFVLFLIALILTLTILIFAWVLTNKKEKKLTSQDQPPILQSTIVKGDNAVMPDYLLRGDFPIYPDAQVIQVTDAQSNTTVIMKTVDKFDAVKKYYTNFLEKNQWLVEVTYDKENAFNFSVSKGKEKGGVTIVRTYEYIPVRENSPEKSASESSTIINFTLSK